MSRQNIDYRPKSGAKAVSPQKISQVVLHSEFTDGGGASGTLDLDEQIPFGALVLSARIRVLEASTGTNPTLTIGDGSDADRYNTGTPDVSSAGEVDPGVVSGQATHGSDTTVTLTLAEDTDFGSIDAGRILVEVFFLL